MAVRTVTHPVLVNYPFPRITHIQDVLPAIAGSPEFRVTVRDWYTVIHYAVMLQDTFEGEYAGIRRECRGLVFDSETGKLLARPYHKVFNLGQEGCISPDLSRPHTVLEKLDGSMVFPIPTLDLDSFRLATKAGVTDTSLHAEEFITTRHEYGKFIRMCIRSEMTPVFEWCSRKDRVVVDYGPEDKLILTALRLNETGNYVSWHSLPDLSRYWGIPIVDAVEVNGITGDLEEYVNYVRSWEGVEGVVIRFEDGHMAKVKTEEYVIRHKAKDGLRTERDVLRIVLDDAVDDLVPLLPDSDANRLMTYQSEVNKALMVQEDLISTVFADGLSRYPDKRQFATEFVQGLDPCYAPILYAMYSGREPRSVMVELLEKSLSSKGKFEQGRWLLTGARKWEEI